LQIYSLRQSPEVLKRCWDGECAVYITEARETHLLNEPCAQILGRLEQSRASFDALEDFLHSLLEVGEDESVRSLLHEILDSLGKIGLIEACEDIS